MKSNLQQAIDSTPVEQLLRNQNELLSAVIRTWSGIDIDVFNPKPEHINIEDIAHGLSQICRFGGHCDPFISVAQHSINASYLVDEENALCALMHDSAEFVTGDFCSPIKKQIELYKNMEHNIHKVISEKFNIPFPMPPVVKEVDNLLFDMEWQYYMLRKRNPDNIWFYEKYFQQKTMKEIKGEFLERFKELTK